MAGLRVATVADEVLARWETRLADFSEAIPREEVANARAEIEGALQDAPADLQTRLYTTLGMSHWRDSNTPRAVEAFRVVARLSPLHAVALTNLVTALRADGKSRPRSPVRRGSAVAPREYGHARGDEPAVSIIQRAPEEYLGALKINSQMKNALRRAQEHYAMDPLADYEIAARERVQAFLAVHPEAAAVLPDARRAARTTLGDAPVSVTLLGDPEDGELSVRIRFGGTTQEVMAADERFFDAWADPNGAKTRGWMTIGVRRA